MKKPKPAETSIWKQPWVKHQRALLVSPSRRALTLNERRILDCIEDENCVHKGRKNGELVVTHQQFQRFGIHHHSIGPGLRALEALRLLVLTEKGRAGNADMRRPNMFRLTYLDTYANDGRDCPPTEPTNEWIAITSVEDAEKIARKARASVPPGYPRKRRAGRKNSQCRKTRKPMPETGSENSPFPMPETGSDEPQSPMPETGSTI